MHRALALIVVVASWLAACGSKSPPPASPEPAAEQEQEGQQPEGPFYPTECDDYCAEGCPEVELTEECLKDCGCPPDYAGPSDETSATPEE